MRGSRKPDNGNRTYERPAHWRNLYRQALVERDESKLGIRIRETEGAILVELAFQVFTRDVTKRTAHEEAMNNLHLLRQRSSESSGKNRVA